MLDPIDAVLISIQNEIRNYFGWEIDSDLESALKLRDATTSHPFPDLSVIRGENVVVIGAAVKSKEIPEEGLLIVADGSIGAISDYSRVVLVVSDADGLPFIDEAAKARIPFALHAHGDNLEVWTEALQRWPSDLPIIATHQTPNQLEEIYNPGGFTDGDRAVCIAYSLGAANVELVGFSTKEVGKWSGVTNPERKLEKLKWMEKILNKLGHEV